MQSAYQPTPPARLHALAKEILEELRNKPAAASIILGGGVALQHYCEYRETRDIDAWWESQPRSEAEKLLREVMQQVGQRHGMGLRVRNWGDTQSYELQEKGRTVFSFQVAVRSVALEPAYPSAWPPVQIETLLDNLGAKMNALVARGAPRDFLDAFTVVDRGIASVDELWAAWGRKNPSQELPAAKANVLRRLEELDSRRPLDSITDSKERENANRVRSWTRAELCKEMP